MAVNREWDQRHVYPSRLLDLVSAEPVETTLPLLRRRSLINKDAKAADGVTEPEFSQRIRASLPTIAR
jgi:hypothetical protein